MFILLNIPFMHRSTWLGTFGLCLFNIAKKSFKFLLKNTKFSCHIKRENIREPRELLSILDKRTNRNFTVLVVISLF